MKNRIAISFLLTLTFTTLVSAQDWQWEMYEGDYRNPTGFPQGFPDCAGDFDGNGIDELLFIDNDGYRVYLSDTSQASFHWLFNPISGTQQFILGCAKPTVIDIDGDGADELIIGPDWCAQIYTLVCWKLVFTDPWTWEQRDDLIEPWLINEEWLMSVHQVAFGDIDSDGSMNIIFNTSHYVYTVLDFAELDSTGTLVDDGDYSNTAWQAHNILVADFDRDGDDDLAIQADSFYTMDHTPFILMMENDGGELRNPLLLEPTCPVYNIVAGDFDGDGNQECITDRNTDPRHFEITYYDDYLQVRHLADLTRFDGRVMGNLLTIAGTTITDVVGFQNWTRTNDYGVTLGSQLKKYTEQGWLYANCDLTGEGHILSTGLCMLPGDDYPDLIEIIRTFDGSGVQERWRALRGYRFTDGDFFYPPVQYITERFTDNPDTLFSSPQLGIAGYDPVPDLFVIAEPSGEPSQIMVFESDWSVTGTTSFVNHPEWTSGLPTEIELIRTTDLDGDGISEIFTRSDSVHWQLYYFEGVRWYDYTSILPDFESAELGFADFDNDGDIDIFTDEDVWISLSPSPSSDDFIPQPSSFILSAYPNPFNPFTTIRFSMPEAGRVSLDVFNIRGQLVESLLEQPMTAGEYSVTFDGSALPSGVYFANLTTTGQTAAHKLLLLK
ncbi:T9SS type A sorting domain-containing protein [bacterium]|nr:T9SS type A sorting domain-containing protein [bacterium]